MWVRQSSWVWSNSIVVREDAGLVLVDPGIDGSEMSELADDAQALGLPVVRGVLHAPPLGPPAVAPPVRRRPALRHRGLRPDGDGGQRASAGDGGGQRLGRPPRAGRPRQPAAGGRRTRAGHSRRARGARRRSRRGPPRGPWGPARRRHALGRPDPAARPSSTEPGRRLRGGPRAAGRCCRAGRRRASPGHGAVAEGAEVAARLAADHAYIDALRRGAEPVDARLEQDWLAGPHRSNLELARDCGDATGGAAAGTGADLREGPDLGRHGGRHRGDVPGRLRARARPVGAVSRAAHRPT